MLIFMCLSCSILLVNCHIGLAAGFCHGRTVISSILLYLNRIESILLLLMSLILLEVHVIDFGRLDVRKWLEFADMLLTLASSHINH